MRITVEVVGEDEVDVAVDPGATYAELLAGVGVSPHEATVLVDGRPVPEDGEVDAERVQVLRLVTGG